MSQISVTQLLNQSKIIREQPKNNPSNLIFSEGMPKISPVPQQVHSIKIHSRICVKTTLHCLRYLFERASGFRIE